MRRADGATCELPDLSQLPERFDALGTGRTGSGRAIHTLTLQGGRVARYIDEGDPEWRSVVFLGGLGTSVGAFYLTEFARSLLVALRLRVISVERNGFGETPLDSSLGYDDGADDVLAVLAALGVERFSIVAFSGGGRYAAALAADLQAMWRFPVDSAVHLILGFARAARDEGGRALGHGENGADALTHDWRLLSTEPLPDLSAVRAPPPLLGDARRRGPAGARRGVAPRLPGRRRFALLRR